MTAVNQTDPFLWLEDVTSPDALSWVASQNAHTLERLQRDERFDAMYAEALGILQAEDRFPELSMQGEHYYSFWQDRDHVRGVWRRIRQEDFHAGRRDWEVVLDLDGLALVENESWVWRGVVHLPVQDEARCLISLSQGGKDAAVIREFDLRTREFVADGFFVPESKSSAVWRSRDELLLAWEHGEGSRTDSGYPREVVLWKRGTPLESATPVFTCERSDMSVRAASVFENGLVTVVIIRALDFYRYELFLWNGERLERLPVPVDAVLETLVAGQLILRLASDWHSPGARFSAGSLVAFEPRAGTAELLFEPSERMAISAVNPIAGGIVVTRLEDVRSGLVAIRFIRDASGAGNWVQSVLASDEGVELWASDRHSSSVVAVVSDFLQPGRLMRYSLPDWSGQELQRREAQFDSAGVTVEQRHATSRDGTRVPYFLIRPANATADGPTLLYGYGGFRVSLVPFYLGVGGRLWVERGGTYVVANIRGGGEFGPRWHQAALRENRQRAFDDFIAVAEDLIAAGVTLPAKLAIHGGSNGGLLVGAVATQRPELFRAVVCTVPLLDMLRYHKLLAGASWMAEYGNADEDDAAAHAIRAYSPYQKVQADKDYPFFFFLTSTRDDRVHPGHARKMAARLAACAKDFLYYENSEGGHAGAADLTQVARVAALRFVFLHQMLGR